MAFGIGTNLGLGLGWDDGANQWGSPMNRNLLVLDTLAFIYARSRTYADPAQVPSADRVPGVCYIVAPTSTSEWEAGTGVSANKIALYTGASGTPWVVFTPRNGWTATIEDLAENDRRLVYLDGEWVASSSLSVDAGFTMGWKEGVDQSIGLLEAAQGGFTQAAQAAQAAAEAAEAWAMRSMIPPIVTASGNVTMTKDIHLGAYVITTGTLGKTLTVPEADADPDLNFPIGGQIAVRQGSAGAVTLEAPTGVTLLLPYQGSPMLAGPGATATLIKRSDTEWDVAGQMAFTGAALGRLIQVVTEGAEYTPDRLVDRMLLSSASAIAINCKITFPLGEYDGQRFSIAASDPVNLTLDGTDTETVSVGTVALAIGGSITYEYEQASTSWLVSV